MVRRLEDWGRVARMGHEDLIPNFEDYTGVLAVGKTNLEESGAWLLILLL